MRVQMSMAAIVYLVMADSDVARSQSMADRAAAEQLFQEARALMKTSDFAAACPKLEASFRLDPALGTQLNLALCYEHMERLASAWAYYRGAADRAAQVGQARRAELARARAAELEPRVPRLKIRVQAAARLPGLVVVRDGAALDPALFGKPLYVDAGDHRVGATAPRHQPFVLDVRLVAGEERVIEVPRLAPVIDEEDQRSDGLDAAPAAAEHDVEPARDPEPEQGAGTEAPAGARELEGMLAGAAGPAQSPHRTVAWISGGTGAVGLVLGLGVGWTANRSAHKLFADDICNRNTKTCVNDDALARLEGARTRARVATVVTGSGIALMAAGAVLLWTTRTTGESTHSAHMIPMVGPSELGLAVTGRF